MNPEVEAQIERGLKAGQISQRALARETAVSRGTVGAIAAGRRPADLSRQHLAAHAAARRSTAGPPPIVGRCPGCGRLIGFPCPACRDEAARAQGISDFGFRISDFGVGGRDQALTIALRDDDAERYLALRHAKESEFLGQVRDAATARAEEQESEDLPTTADLLAIESTERSNSLRA